MTNKPQQYQPKCFFSASNYHRNKSNTKQSGKNQQKDNSDKNNSEKSQSQNEEISSRSLREDWFQPERKLYFDKSGYCLITTAESGGVSRYGLYFLSLLFFYFAQKGFFKLLDIKNRGFIGFFWYCGYLAIGVYGLRKTVSYGRNLVTSVNLHKSGKNVNFKTVTHPIGSIETKIVDIVRPASLSQEFMNNEKLLFMMGLGSPVYPIIIEGQCYYQPQDMKFEHQDVFKAIFSNKNIIVD